MTAAPATPLLGSRYALGEPVGRGGMAQVLRATDSVLGREVAVKLFHPHVEDVDRTASEIALLAALDHPGLVSLLDAGTTADGAPYLVMELVEGPTLASCCLDGSLSPEQVAGVGADLAEALAHCHERGVVHRDVKPANVLLTAEGRAKLTDFGIARLVDATRHTATGMTVGTAPYLAPEQVRGGVVGPPSDVYALGLVLLETLTGRREYAGSDPVACAVERLHRDPHVPAWLPGPWRSVLSRMTARDPADRPSASDVAAVLRGRAPAAPTAGHDDATPRPPTSRTRAVPAPHVGSAAVLPRREAPWVAAVRARLVDDLVARALVGTLALLVLLAVVAAAVQAVGSPGPSDPPAADLTPVEQLEESVRR